MPALARANRRYHDDACRSLAARRRRREHVERQFGQSVDEQVLRDAVERATSELRLLANLAAAAWRGNVRANIWLLQTLHGYGERSEDVTAAVPVPDDDDPFAEVVELAARRREALGRS